MTSELPPSGVVPDLPPGLVADGEGFRLGARGLVLDLVSVPAGVYITGSDDPTADADERPRRSQELCGFWIGRTAITVAQYAKFCAATGRAAPTSDPELPITEVSWVDADAFCRWVGVALPTELEWEQAARGPDGRSYPYGDTPGGSFRDLAYPATPVGQGSESPCGARDMGELQEWCVDQVGPQSLLDWIGERRVVRLEHRAIRGGYMFPSVFVTADQDDAWAEPIALWRRNHDEAGTTKRALTFRVVVRPHAPKAESALRDMIEIPAQTTHVGLDPAVIDELAEVMFQDALEEAREEDESSGLGMGWLSKNGRTMNLEGPSEIRTQLLTLGPRREVRVGAFAIDRTRVSNAQYREFVVATGHRALAAWKGGELPAGCEQHPVENVSHDDASAYARWVGLALPTELEWEVACGAGDGRRYPWGNELPPPGGPGLEDLMSLRYRGSGAFPVDAFPELASSYGVLGLLGSWEWCADEFGLLPGGDEAAFRAVAAGKWPVMFALRGGHDSVTRWSIWGRLANRPTQDFGGHGFRCVRRR